jgi:hypothetical protein
MLSLFCAEQLQFRDAVSPTEVEKGFMCIALLGVSVEKPLHQRRQLADRSASSTGVPADRSSSVGWHGYYDSYCYLPLYIFAGDQLLCARLRPANKDAAAGSVEEVSRIVTQVRTRLPQVKIIGAQMHEAHVLHQTTCKAARAFAEFDYHTQKIWSRARRVVAKAEYLDRGENPRFVVT